MTIENEDWEDDEEEEEEEPEDNDEEKQEPLWTERWRKQIHVVSESIGRKELTAKLSEY